MEKNKYKEYKSRHYRENKEKYLARYYRWCANNFEKRLLAIAKCTARRRGHEFDLDVSDIIIPEYCPFLNVKLERGTRGRSEFKASLDRVDSSKGYIKGNVQVISLLANRMKSSATTEQIKTFSENILKIYGNSKF